MHIIIWELLYAHPELLPAHPSMRPLMDPYEKRQKHQFLYSLPSPSPCSAAHLPLLSLLSIFHSPLLFPYPPSLSLCLLCRRPTPTPSHLSLSFSPIAVYLSPSLSRSATQGRTNEYIFYPGYSNNILICSALRPPGAEQYSLLQP